MHELQNKNIEDLLYININKRIIHLLVGEYLMPLQENKRFSTLDTGIRACFKLTPYKADYFYISEDALQKKDNTLFVKVQFYQRMDFYKTAHLLASRNALQDKPRPQLTEVTNNYT